MLLGHEGETEGFEWNESKREEVMVQSGFRESRTEESDGCFRESRAEESEGAVLWVLYVNPSVTWLVKKGP